MRQVFRRWWCSAALSFMALAAGCGKSAQQAADGTHFIREYSPSNGALSMWRQVKQDADGRWVNDGKFQIAIYFAAERREVPDGGYPFTHQVTGECVDGRITKFKYYHNSSIKIDADMTATSGVVAQYRGDMPDFSGQQSLWAGEPEGVVNNIKAAFPDGWK